MSCIREVITGRAPGRAWPIRGLENGLIYNLSLPTGNSSCFLQTQHLQTLKVHAGLPNATSFRIPGMPRACLGRKAEVRGLPAGVLRVQCGRVSLVSRVGPGLSSAAWGAGLRSSLRRGPGVGLAVRGSGGRGPGS